MQQPPCAWHFLCCVKQKNHRILLPSSLLTSRPEENGEERKDDFQEGEDKTSPKSSIRWIHAAVERRPEGTAHMVPADPYLETFPMAAIPAERLKIRIHFSFPCWLCFCKIHTLFSSSQRYYLLWDKPLPGCTSLEMQLTPLIPYQKLTFYDDVSAEQHCIIGPKNEN